MEVKFIMCFDTTDQALRLCNFILELSIVDLITRLLKRYYDNTIVILFFKNDKYLIHSKYIEIKFLVVRKES